MTAYRNFTEDFVSRVCELNGRFKPIALEVNYQVSYLLMRLTSGFLLPYERVEGESDSKVLDIADGSTQLIRSSLELDKHFIKSSYCSDAGKWSVIEVDNLAQGPEKWRGEEVPLDLHVNEVLKVLRNALSHSNVHFGGHDQVEDLYFANRVNPMQVNGEHRIVCCSLSSAEHLMDSWMQKIQGLSKSPRLIWREIDPAA